MFLQFCLWFLLQIGLNAGECSIDCRNSTSSGNTCCICGISFIDETCIAKCLLHQEDCYNCSVSSREEFRDMLIKLRKYTCLGCHYYEHNPSGECMGCPLGCISCFDNTLCYKCVQGMYGKVCNKRCGKCRPDNQGVVKCDTGFGTCTNGCEDGYFGQRCDHECGHCKTDNQGVVKCDFDFGTCTYGCVDGYYSPRCDSVCGHCKPDNQGVVKCDSDFGTCTNGCVDGYYSPRCDFISGHCKPDNQGVVKCDSEFGTCTNGCVDGYYSPRCDSVCGHCKPDNQGVVKCDFDFGTCTNGCVYGYYSSRCDRVCCDTCLKRSCDQQSGFCDNGCVSGWYGDTCEKSCSNTCYNTSCDQYTGYCANACVSGWYGNTCDEICSDTCSLSFCNKTSGFCENGCVPGWHGDKCKESCSSTCYNKSCDQYSGNCANGCVHGWYGVMCNETCSDTCSLSYCNQRSGFCEKGCISGWHGDLCKFNCVDTCKERACDRETSQCLRGCVAGYQGAFCNMTMNTGPDSVLVGFTSSLAGVIILLLFALIIWFIRRVVLRGKRYGNLQIFTKDTSTPTYDEIQENDDTIEVNHASGSHLYMEVGIAHTPRSIHESGPKTLNSSDTEIACKTLAVVETIRDTPPVFAKVLSMSTLHSEVINYNNSDIIHESSFIPLDNAEVHSKSSNLSRKYYEIPEIIPGVNRNITIERNHTNDDYEIPLSSACSTAQNAEADGANLSGQCNRLADSTTSPTRDSKRTQNNDLISTRNNEIDVSDTNQTLQKAKEDKCTLRPPGFHIDMPLGTHQTQENVYEEDSVSLNYIHPVN